MKHSKIGSRVFVANLSGDTTPEEIRALFSAVAEPLHIATNRTPAAVGFAVLDFPRVESAAKVVHRFDGLEFAGRRLQLSTVRPPSNSRP